MGKKKALKKLILQEILTSKARFISIMLLILLGVSFFSGLNSSGPDMLKTAALYFDNQNLMDIHVVSTMGLEDEDIDILWQQEDIDQINVGYSQDVITQKEDKLFKIYSYDKADTINQFEIISGRLPENSGEIALIAGARTQNLYVIGDTVTFVPDSEDTDLSEQFHKTEYTIVGFVKSPMYVSDKQLGSSTIGKGTLDGYGVISKADFNISVYTDAYMTFKSLRGLYPYSDTYKDKISAYADTIEAAFDERAVTRLADIKVEAQEEIDDAKQEIADGKQELADAEEELADAKEQIEDGKVKLADAEEQLLDAKQELTDGEKEYEDNKALFDEQIADGKKQLDIGGNQLADGQNTIDESRKQIEDGKKQIKEGLKQIEEKETELKTQKSQMEEFLAQIEQVIQVPAAYIPAEQQSALIQAGSGIDLGNGQTFGDLLAGYFAGVVSGDTLVSTLNGIIAQIDNGLATISDTKQELVKKQEELEAASKQLADAQEQINTGQDTIIVKNQEFEDAKADGEQQLADAKQQIEDGWTEYNDGVKELEEKKQELADAEQEYEDGLAEYNEEKADALQDIADAEEEIADAEKELADLKVPSYYAFSREDNAGYSEYKDNGERLASIAIVFPAFFFAIAALVSLTTVTRMIEEQRVQIGTLKAQGYTDAEISIKYYVYALGASGVGTALGLIAGFYGVPRIIITAYSSMYDFPNAQYVWYWWSALTSFGIAVFCTGISVWAVLRQELKGTPAILMRPKSPKVGKRIFLERVTPIWNRLNFVQKVTMRNLFRYKQRMIMTVFGIAGCMGLMMTGFGVNDSVSDLADLQFKTLMHYQGMVVFDEDAAQEDKTKAEEAIAGAEGIDDLIMVKQEQFDVKQTGVNPQQAVLIVPKEPERFSDYVLLREEGSDTGYDIPDEGAVITAKLADLFGVREGDTLTVTDSDNQEFEIPVTKIAENYAGHYIYMTAETYEKCFGSEETVYNAALLRYEQDKTWEENLSSVMNEYAGIKAIAFNSSTIELFDDSMGSLNTVVVVIIIAAAILAFVVLYNLTNINVSERIRELSTIKVLGFYDNEVTMYIYRENVILSLFGIFFGSFLGKFLHWFVLDTASMDNMTFGTYLHVHSYVYAGLLTLLFSSMVMWVMHNKLKHVDMIEALKSNE
ncbi:ABC transporter permease [Konateibacter massiliensis]|uniref:ABC transporter permease n=1 Tax=Konateibacter massiliensis TaxID=2002841 RepID=UPI000C1587CD|nr:ABC transporter permease [Konateibacter massiliensis]